MPIIQKNPSRTPFQGGITRGRLDVAVRDYRKAVAANSGTISGETLAFLSDFVGECRDVGIWSKLWEVWPFCGENLAGALTKLKTFGTPAVLTGVNLVAGDFTERGAGKGLKGNAANKRATSGLNSLMWPVVFQGHVSAHRTFQNTTASTRWSLGSGDTCITRDAGRVHSAGGQGPYTNDATGCIITVSRASNFLKSWLNGTGFPELNSARPDQRTTDDIGLFCRTTAGPTYDRFDDCALGFASFGDSLTDSEVLLLNAAILRLQAKLTRNI